MTRGIKRDSGQSGCIFTSGKMCFLRLVNGSCTGPWGFSGKAGKDHLRGMSCLKIVSWPMEVLNAATWLWSSIYRWFGNPLPPYLYCAVLGSLNKCCICSKYFGCTTVYASTRCVLLLPSPEASWPSGGSFSIPEKSLLNSHQLIFVPFPFHQNGYLLHWVVLHFINSLVLLCSYLCSLCMFQHLLEFLVFLIIRFSTRETGRPCHEIWRQLPNGCAGTLGKE